MKRLLPLLAILLSTTASAQVTRTEVTKATTPKDDAKPNSASVPDVYAVSSQFERVVILRFKFQTDLLAGFEKAVKRYGLPQQKLQLRTDLFRPPEGAQMRLF